MELSSDDGPTLPVGVTFSGQRQVAEDLQHQAKVLAVQLEEHTELQRARLQSLGMDSALLVMEARKTALEKNLPRIKEMQQVCLDAIEGNTDELKALENQDPAKFPDRHSRIRMRYAQTAKILEELLNLQSTHPVLDQKTTFVKVDARGAQITPKEGGDRLRAASVVNADPQ